MTLPMCLVVDPGSEEMGVPGLGSLPPKDFFVILA